MIDEKSSDLDDISNKLNTASISNKKNKRKKPNTTINSTIQSNIDMTVIENNNFKKCEGFSWIDDTNESIYTKIPLQLLYFNKDKYNFVLENEKFHSNLCYERL